MFTGLVEEIGTILRAERAGTRADTLLTIAAEAVTADASPGDSISVSGVCLTVVRRSPEGAFTAEVMRETLERSTLDRAEPGTRVNLERALRADSRLGGHLVQGHVDAVGELRSRTGASAGTTCGSARIPA
ncbi:riboflavin synthase [Gulosibacter sp. 10]|uniref:riboflavin synthase n=1 Tax=Gulosibacter sp. 10 TaxID=1255570 RepID=UPI00097EE6E3|nr:Riboflavin synthase eubacterial/eukaryotic [Gulosibacter sp. 10]